MLRLIIAFLLIGSPFLSYAVEQCGFSNGSYLEVPVTIGTVSVQRDTPVGTVLKAVNLTFPLTSGYCGDGDGDVGTFNTWGLGIYATTTSLDKVYATNIPGVGIRQSVEKYGTLPVLRLTQPGYVSAISAGTVELVKTGSVTQSGSLQPGTIMNWGVGAGNNAPPTFQLMKWNLVSGDIVAIACSMRSGGGLAFPIGDVKAEQFTQIGTYSKETSKADLTLDCDQDANINITLTGTQNSDSSDQSVLALTGQGPDDSVAQGIGVQLLYNDKPLKLNEMLNLKTSAGGQESFPITARYIQTKEKVKAGSANATATLNVTYQ
ncbi:fimbrial protein [Enterobacter wuhouensis]